MEIPNEKELLDNIGKIAYTLDKAYISRLSADYGVWYFDEKYNKDKTITYQSNIRAVQVKKWVFDKDEKPGECFKNVLSAFADGDHTIAMVIKRRMHETEMYFVIKNDGKGRNEQSADNAELLESVLRGNFPGSEINKLKFDLADNDGNEIIPEIFGFNESESVAVLANTPSEYSEDYITQGLDKLLDGIVPHSADEEYSIIFLAESISQNDLREILSGYEDIATAIYPFANYQFQTGSNETETHGEMSSIANTKSISESVFKTHSVNVNINGNVNKSRNMSLAFNTTELASGLGSALGGLVGGFIGGPAGAVVGETLGLGLGNLVPNVAIGKQEGCGIGGGFGYGYSWGKSKTISNGTTETSGTSSSLSVGKSENTSYNYKSYMVQNLLQKLEETMKRISRSQAMGLWKFSSYVMASRSSVSINVANYLRAITQGRDSYVEPSMIQEWSDREGADTSEFKEIRKYLSHFCHPLFVTIGESADSGMMVTPTSYISTDELGHVVSFPRKSIQGIPVYEGVRFGREPHALTRLDNDLDIGYGYHMHQVIKSTRIKISKEEFTKHVFITGSTGAGKSNTIYKILDALGRQNVNLLVVEPAKGEYKDVLGKRKGVVTYGTNPRMSDIEMLKLNPFKFPRSIHVLEHIDRIVEIFNVCWPMYAAMPAILKDSIERAYVASGWNLENSENKYSQDLFPTFSDVVKQIKIVLDESDYSVDNKGDYTGALVTRLKSLTNGINGLIFVSDDLSDEEIFDANVIVDLSRVGSTETKSLIMGLLVLKLQEHRMEQRANGNNLNDLLRHVTVLEEAHNLLRKTSTEQSSEGSNLLGKSVEMLSNSIAEMRTYGEGFIIADQSPGLLDMSVIRNTNTKIIMRLPDYSDRELVGKSAGLNESQITEISRIERGVAAITQSDWLEPVLCMIDEYISDGEPFWHGDTYVPENENNQCASVEQSLLQCIMNKEIYRKGDRVDIGLLKRDVIRSKLDTSVKCDFLDYISSEDYMAVEKLRHLVYDFFEAGKAMDKSKGCSHVKDWVHGVVEKLNPSVKGYTNQQIDILLSLIINEQALRDVDYQDVFVRFTEIYRKEGRVF
jgi:energy-coupling factor transporter ATP-binding protein EcfA2